MRFQSTCTRLHNNWSALLVIMMLLDNFFLRESKYYPFQITAIHDIQKERNKSSHNLRYNEISRTHLITQVTINPCVSYKTDGLPF